MDKNRPAGEADGGSRSCLRRQKKGFILALLVLLALAALITPLYTAPAHAQDAGPTATPLMATSAAATATPTHTPIPPEFAANSQQTLGITFAGAVLVLIVLIGVLVFLPKKLGM